MTGYTQTQKNIADAYQTKAFLYMESDPDKSAEVIAEFAEIKKKWDEANEGGK